MADWSHGRPGLPFSDDIWIEVPAQTSNTDWPYKVIAISTCSVPALEPIDLLETEPTLKHTVSKRYLLPRVKSK
jgi:hypothetical protein